MSMLVMFFHIRSLEDPMNLLLILPLVKLQLLPRLCWIMNVNLPTKSPYKCVIWNALVVVFKKCVHLCAILALWLSLLLMWMMRLKLFKDKWNWLMKTPKKKQWLIQLLLRLTKMVKQIGANLNILLSVDRHPSVPVLIRKDSSVRG